MASPADKTAYQKWLDRLDENAKPTPKGTRVSLTLYVFPDGHGTICYLRPETKTLDEQGNQPVNNIEEAAAAFRALWEQAIGRPE